MKYVVTWRCNHAMFGIFESNNLRKAISDVNEILLGRTFIGSGYSYEITGNGKDCLHLYHSGKGYKKSNGKLRRFNRKEF